MAFALKYQIIFNFLYARFITLNATLI
jgi:hypothetical protein